MANIRGGSEQEELLLGALENGDFETALQLVPRDGSIVRLGPDKLTPLHYACHHGRTDIVRLLITDFNYTFEDRSGNGQTPLHTASKSGHLNCIEEYMRIQNSRPRVHANLEQNDEVILELEHPLLGNFSPQDKNGDTPLHIAASHGLLPVVRYLTETAHCDLGCKNVASETPFHLAAKHGCLDTVKYLLNRHFHLPHTEYQIRNALFLAAKNEQLEVFIYLIRELHCPQYLKIRIDSGQTILHAACRKGHLDTVKELTRDFNCDPSCCDENGDTPLHLASAHGHLQVVKFLTDNMQCSPLCRNYNNTAPLHAAAFHGHVDVLLFFIGDKGCSPTWPGWNGRTPLHYASQEGHGDVVRFLTTHIGVEPSLSDENGVTPLHLASAQGHMEIVRFLTNEMDCNPLCQTVSSQETPFHWAAQRGHVNIVQFFVEEKHCDQMCQDYYGRTPLHYASKTGKLDVVKYLTIQAKADPLAKDSTLYSSENLVVRSPVSWTQDWFAKSPLDVACDMDDRDTVFFFASKGAKSSNRKLKRWNPLYPRMKICAIGYHGTGKTTLVAALQNESRSAPINITEPTTGIVPTDFSPEFGNITFYDFAGDKEYYASHEAILGDLSHPLYLVVLNLEDNPDEIRNALHFWEFLIYNALSSNCQRNGISPDTLLARIIAVGSHSDCLVSGELRSKSEALAHIMQSPSPFPSLKHAGRVTLDCRRPSSQGMKMLHQNIQCICKQVCSQADFDYQNGHLLRTFVEQHLSYMKVCNFNDLLGWVLDVEDTKFQPLKSSPQVLYQACKALNVSGDLILLTEGESPDDSWLVLNRDAFLREVHSLLPLLTRFRAINGLLSHSQIKSVAQGRTHLNPELVIRYMRGMDMCTKIDVNHIPSYNHHRGEEYYFFPSLIDTRMPEYVWTPSTQFTEFFGWCIHCTDPHRFFTPKCVDMLLLSIHKLVPNLSPDNCRVWKYGICWWHPDGIETVVEVPQQSKKFVVVMRCLNRSEVKFIKHRSSVIEQILSIQKTFCPEVNVKELVIHTHYPHQQHYPLEVAAEISMTDVALSIVNKHPNVISSCQEHRFLKLNDLIFFEPYQGLGKELLRKIFNPAQKPTKCVPETDLHSIARALHKKWELLAEMLDIAPEVITELERDTKSDPIQKCMTVLTSWSQRNGTFVALRQDLGQYSIFFGRNPLVSLIL